MTYYYNYLDVLREYCSSIAVKEQTMRQQFSLLVRFVFYNIIYTYVLNRPLENIIIMFVYFYFRVLFYFLFFDISLSQ